MNRTVVMWLKAIAGIAVLVLLMITVSNWWGDYRTEADKKATTKAASPTGEKGSGESAGTDAADSAGTVVVVTDGLNLREEPSSEGKSITGLEKGQKLVLIKKDGKWYQVKTADGQLGWISASPSYTRVEGQ